MNHRNKYISNRCVAGRKKCKQVACRRGVTQNYSQPSSSSSSSTSQTHSPQYTCASPRCGSACVVAAPARLLLLVMVQSCDSARRKKIAALGVFARRSQISMNRLLSAFRGLVLPVCRASFATSTSSAQVSATAPLRTAVSVVQPPNGDHFPPFPLPHVLIVYQMSCGSWSSETRIG
jgi:hypothetical protein